jgi:hypothetical protein
VRSSALKRGSARSDFSAGSLLLTESQTYPFEYFRFYVAVCLKALWSAAPV